VTFSGALSTLIFALLPKCRRFIPVKVFGRISKSSAINSVSCHSFSKKSAITSNNPKICI
jgi:hypothetical protein